MYNSESGGLMREMQHFTLAEKVKNLLATAGLGIAATADPGYSTGARVEIDDPGSGEVAVYVAWRVHPTLYHHFLTVDPARLAADERVALKVQLEKSMYQALRSVLEYAGFRVDRATGERAGELHVTPGPQ
ncbi:hypothetical protein [Streptomyces sp. TRM68367]|uniref:hypothetical protein n=1 Tax=Streptomyces sp. TRM68367 TaxID=2758415 RepID=UPI00165AFB10|nr:hypothetical protein [Streptomyces sp. TRM68367]MBC9731555.1 hypothetical protein [Streptomyces sp. TRM68367]